MNRPACLRLVSWAMVAASAPGLAQPGPAPGLPSGTAPQVMMMGPPCASGCLNPAEAVTLASQLGDRGGLAGQFRMMVRGVGAQNGFVYLNSEADYRDRNCLTIALPATVAVGLFGTGDADAIRARLQDQTIVVTGVARRVRIDFTIDGQPSGKYYYQVHVQVRQARQFLVLP